MSYAARRATLVAELEALPSVAVAFSGGVDSSVLLHAAHLALGEAAVAVIADSPSLPRSELDQARSVAAAIGARLEVVRTDELTDERYAANRGDRCYFCKRALFDAMAAVCGREGLAAMAFGEIADDALDDRPGARAAREARVLAPLARAGFGKDDVRRYAREAGLAVADKPASACLASRVPVGTRVTGERLARVERAEAALRGLGLTVLRVRDHHPLARLEVGAAELALARSQAGTIGALLRRAGFVEWRLETYVRPDLRAASRVPDRGAPQPINRVP